MMTSKIRCGEMIDLVSGKRRQNVDLWLINGKIGKISEKIGRAAEEEIDLSRFYVIPGFVDAHNHLCLRVGGEAAPMMEALAYQVLLAVKHARFALLSGVTTLRDAGERGYVDLFVRRGIEEGIIPGPRLLVAGPGFLQSCGRLWFMGREAGGHIEVRKTVRKQLKAGIDFIRIFVSGAGAAFSAEKTVPGSSREEIEAAVYEARAAGRNIGVQTHGGEAATWAIEAGVDAVEHGCFLTEEQLLMMRECGTWLVVTSGIQRAIRDCAGNSAFMREKAGVAYANYLSVVRRAVELGISLAVGNDTNHGCIAEEIAFLERAGMERRAALLAATLGGASLCGIEEEIGTLDIGKEADLIAFERDPLTAAPRELVPAWVIRSGKVMKNPVGVCS